MQIGLGVDQIEARLMDFLLGVEQVEQRPRAQFQVLAAIQHARLGDAGLAKFQRAQPTVQARGLRLGFSQTLARLQAGEVFGRIRCGQRMPSGAAARTDRTALIDRHFEVEEDPDLGAIGARVLLVVVVIKVLVDRGLQRQRRVGLGFGLGQLGLGLGALRGSLQDGGQGVGDLRGVTGLSQRRRGGVADRRRRAPTEQTGQGRLPACVLRLEFLQRRRRAFGPGLRLDHIGTGAGAHVAALFGQVDDATDALNLFTGNLKQTLITLHFDVGPGGVAGDVVDRQQNSGLTARHPRPGGVD